MREICLFLLYFLASVISIRTTYLTNMHTCLVSVGNNLLVLQTSAMGCPEHKLATFEYICKAIYLSLTFCQSNRKGCWVFKLFLFFVFFKCGNILYQQLIFGYLMGCSMTQSAFKKDPQLNGGIRTNVWSRDIYIQWSQCKSSSKSCWWHAKIPA